MKIFDTPPKPGMPIRHGTFFKALLRMGKAWEQLRVHNGHIDWAAGMPTIVVDESAGGASSPSGRAWVGQKPMITYDDTEVGATRFLYLKSDGSGYTWAASMPNSQPADGVVYDLDQTAGDIHLTGIIAPGG